MEQVRPLPLGIQSFEVLREQGYMYVDKTAMIYRLVSTYSPYFFSRPRRFGKSLLMDGIEVQSSDFAEYRADVSNPIPMIYQSGYLTISDYDKKFKMYTLKFPNEEVRYGFLNFLMPYYTAVTNGMGSFHIANFCRELEAGDTEAFMER